MLCSSWAQGESHPEDTWRCLEAEDAAFLLWLVRIRAQVMIVPEWPRQRVGGANVERSVSTLRLEPSNMTSWLLIFKKFSTGVSCDIIANCLERQTTKILSWICKTFLCVCVCPCNAAVSPENVPIIILKCLYQRPFCVCSVCYYTQSGKVSGGRGAHAKLCFFISDPAGVPTFPQVDHAPFWLAHWAPARADAEANICCVFLFCFFFEDGFHSNSSKFDAGPGISIEY